MRFRILSTDSLRAQYFGYRFRYFSSFSERHNFVLKLFPFPKQSQWYKRVRFDSLPYWYKLDSKLIYRNERRNPFFRMHLKNIRNPFFNQRFLFNRLVQLFKYTRRYLISKILYSRKKQRDRRIYFFFLRSFNRGTMNLFFRSFFSNDVYLYGRESFNWFFPKPESKVHFLSIPSYTSLLFLKFIYICIKRLSFFFSDFSILLILNKLLFFVPFNYLFHFPFVQKLSVYINRLLYIYYLCFKLNLLDRFMHYYNMFKYKILSFISITKTKISFKIGFFFSKLIYSFFLSTDVLLLLNRQKWFSSMYIIKERLYLEKSYRFLFHRLYRYREPINKYVSFLYIRSTSYNTYLTFVFNGNVLYKRSAGMFEANRKCRLQYDVIKDMSAHFFASPKFFLIKYPIKKIHLILNGFKKLQRYVLNGITRFRSPYRYDYIGAMRCYLKMKRHTLRFLEFLNIKGLLYRKYKHKKYLIALYKKYKKYLFLKKNTILDALSNLYFLFRRDYIFLVSHLPFNGCRGRRFGTKRKRR